MNEVGLVFHNQGWLATINAASLGGINTGLAAYSGIYT
jgi:hypothetical protein